MFQASLVGEVATKLTFSTTCLSGVRLVLALVNLTFLKVIPHVGVVGMLEVEASIPEKG